MTYTDGSNIKGNWIDDISQGHGYTYGGSGRGAQLRPAQGLKTATPAVRVPLSIEEFKKLEQQLTIELEKLNKLNSDKIQATELVDVEDARSKNNPTLNNLIEKIKAAERENARYDYAGKKKRHTKRRTKRHTKRHTKRNSKSKKR